MSSLWPDQLKKVTLKAPVTILREQASILGQKTKNIVEGRVYQPESSFSYNDAFEYDFVVLAPALQNYRYRLFTIIHNTNLYPVSFDLDKDIEQELLHNGKSEAELTAQSEEELTSILRGIFGSEKTLHVIGSMLAQSE